MTSSMAAGKTQPKMFETELCGRCYGSGHYSFNLMDGSKCYGCNGAGWKLTKAGAAARAAYRAAYTKTKPASEIVAGDKIIDTKTGRRQVYTVTESGPDTLNPGQNRWNFKFAPGGYYGGMGTFADTETELPVTAEEKRAAWDAICHMPGAMEWPA